MDLKEYQEMWQDMAGKQDLFMYAVVAMEASRGIGLDLQLPWPFLRGDHNHYISLMRALKGFIHPKDFYLDSVINTPLNVDEAGVKRMNQNLQCLCQQASNKDLPEIAEMKRTIAIVGRKTWECMGTEEKNLETFFVVVSRSADELKLGEYGAVPAGSFNEGVCLSYALYREGVVGRVCVLGGANIYKEALDSGLCRRLYVTKVLQDFPCNVFMPPFEHMYQLDRTTVDGEGGVVEERGVRYQYLEYMLKTI